MWWLRLPLGLVLSVGIAWLAYRRDSLAPGGVVGAVAVGTLIFGLGGIAWGLVLIAFFVSSSLLSHYGRARKEQVAEKFAKGSRRDLGQTLANGGLGSLLALTTLLLVDLAGRPRAGSPCYAVLTLAFLGSMAAVNADTWATELGVLSANPPRLLTSGQVVPPGTSGAVSRLGMLAALGGSLFIGLAAWLFFPLDRLVGFGQPRLPTWLMVAGPTLAGLVGTLVDSWLGASLQQVYWCPCCGCETERRQHICGSASTPLRGLSWLNNDVVNFLASAVGGLVAGGLGLLIIG